jgi:hypothetical protein
MAEEDVRERKGTRGRGVAGVGSVRRGEEQCPEGQGQVDGGVWNAKPGSVSIVNGSKI